MQEANYDPQLSQAGFMDLVCAIQQRMKTADAKKTLAAMPQDQQEAAWQLEAAAKNYVEAIEGGCRSGRAVKETS